MYHHNSTSTDASSEELSKVCTIATQPVLMLSASAVMDSHFMREEGKKWRWNIHQILYTISVLTLCTLFEKMDSQRWAYSEVLHLEISGLEGIRNLPQALSSRDICLINIASQHERMRRYMYLFCRNGVPLRCLSFLSFT